MLHLMNMEVPPEMTGTPLVAHLSGRRTGERASHAAWLNIRHASPAALSMSVLFAGM
jgi:hypothetical protein